MKKLALTFATLGLLAAPVLACPNMDSDKPAEIAAPRTAEKTKDQPKAKEQPKKAEPAKPSTDTAKKAPEKAPEKKADKVSSR